MKDDLLNTPNENEKDEEELLECLNCEARYSISLGEDYLYQYSWYCPFCGEYIVRSD
jgi:predicted RNA-binding Zn-ribbon protein involved in translation (DUF1610 family)